MLEASVLLEKVVYDVLCFLFATHFIACDVIGMLQLYAAYANRISVALKDTFPDGSLDPYASTHPIILFCVD